jgi:ElaB/YqjD/DUF883 family membrane-anchored ribosome-binding protein
MADEKPEVIQKQIAKTSSSLKEKVEQLEEQVLDTVKETTDAVSDTVENVKESVAETIENVKETVQETVASVKRTFDLKHQTEQHPWAMLGGSVVAGFAVGKLIGSWGRHVRRRHSTDNGHTSTAAAATPTTSFRGATVPSSLRTEASRSAQPGLFSRLFSRFDKEINTVKEMAVGTLVGVLRDMAKHALPASLSSKVEDVMNSVTTKLGGEPIRGPVTESCPPR